MSKPGKAPVKSNCLQTCNLLSQYFKENGSFGDLSLGMTRKLEPKENPETSLPTSTTMDLLTTMENSTAALIQNDVAPSNVQPMDFLPQFGCFGSPNSIDIATNKVDFSRKPAIKEPVRAQMTIFYAGQVLVLNDFPADRAREIMALASKGGSSTSSGFIVTSGMNKFNSGSSMAPESSIVATPEKNATQDRRRQQQAQVIASDLPIARKASLHRFLDKRKDRAAAKAPYQVNPPFQARGKQSMD